METKTVIGWHFASDKLRDGRPLPKAGETLKHDGPVVPCEQGLHASVRAIDALGYAPGAMVARVELRGRIVAHGDDKHAASERYMLTGYMDASRALFLFACDCAAAALDAEEAAGRTVDPRSRAAVACRRLWLDGAATDADLSAAYSAAYSAAWSAAAYSAESAAWSAAESAAGSAAESAAESSARSARAAESAAGSAAESARAAESAARSAQNAALESRLLALFESEV